jgi:hypothetical protein
MRLVAVRLLRAEYARHGGALARFRAQAPARRGAVKSGTKHVAGVRPQVKAYRSTAALAQ